MSDQKGCVGAVVGASLGAATFVVGGGIGWAIVTGHGRLAAACTVSALTAASVAALLVYRQNRAELEELRAQVARWSYADTQYELDTIGPLLPPERRPEPPSSMPRSIGPRRWI